MNLNKVILDNEPPRTQLKHKFTFATEVCYNCRAVSAPIKQLESLRSTEWRSLQALDVKTASGNWKHPLPLKIIVSVRFQWLLF